MMLLYAVRMRLVFISSVTASTPLRTISVSTASACRTAGFPRDTGLDADFAFTLLDFAVFMVFPAIAV